jgi:hypothetical protein
MTASFFKSKLFWIGVFQFLISAAELFKGIEGWTPAITIITGILTLVINLLDKPGTPSLTPADNARRSWLERVYAWTWFHVEAAWIKSEPARRPFTYIMRDFWAQHRFWGWTIFIVVSVAIAYACVWSAWFLPVFGFHGMLFAHLNWGSPYKTGEQERPEYTGRY